MEEYKDISRGLKMLLDKAEEMGWNWEAYIEPVSYTHLTLPTTERV